MGSNRRMMVAAAAAAAAAAVIAGGWVMRRNGIESYGWDWDQRGHMMKVLTEMRDWMRCWAIPAYVTLHTLTLALCLPYAVFFEAGASLLFGFIPALLCVFSAKILGASLSFSVGRLVFRSSSTAMKWAQRNRYFHLLSRGVERDGWKFVLLARFSPIPSYVINYALSATKIGFIVDFLLPTVIGCLRMILQNTSIASLAGAAVALAAGTQKPKVWSYIFPLVGISSSILISLRIKRYSTSIPVAAESSLREDTHDYNNNASSLQTSSGGKENNSENKSVKRKETKI